VSIWLYKCNNKEDHVGQRAWGDWLEFFDLCRRSRRGESEWGGSHVTAQNAALRLARNAQVGQVVLCWQSWNAPVELEAHRQRVNGRRNGLVGIAEITRIRPSKHFDDETDFFFRPVVEFQSVVDLLGELDRSGQNEFRGPFEFPRKAGTFVELSDAEARAYLDICGATTDLRPLRAVPARGATQRSSGQGFGDREHTVAVEQAAIARVRAALRRDGWTFRSVERDNVGYDIAARRGREHAHIEVKGTTGSKPDFILTENERRVADRDSNWHLWVVTNALGARPRDHRYTASQYKRAFDLTAISWRAAARGKR